MNQLEKAVVSRKQFDDAAESIRKLYTDMFEETHELRKRMWDLGTSLFVSRRTRNVCDAQTARHADVGAAARGSRASSACADYLAHRTTLVVVWPSLWNVVARVPKPPDSPSPSDRAALAFSTRRGHVVPAERNSD